MRIPTIAAALPLCIGIGCSTSSSQAPRTASTTATPDAGASRPAPATAADAGAPTQRDGSGPSGDQVVAGTIAGVSAQAVTITGSDGESRTLRLVPLTTFQVDGREAQGTDLQEGQPVRATFDTLGGEDVAVVVEAGQGVDTSVGLTPGSDMGSGRTSSGGDRSAPQRKR